MKRKIKALGILLSDFYKAREKKIDAMYIYFFILMGIICLTTCMYKIYQPIEFSKSELEYCEEKVEEIVSSDIRAISNIVKEMEEKGYYLTFNHKEKELIVYKKDARKARFIFSYSSKISKEVSYKYAKENQIAAVIFSVLVGFVIGYLIGFVSLSIIKKLIN